MAEKNVQARIQHKHDTEANWNKATGFIPKAGELIIYDVDADHEYARVKIGDGVTAIDQLNFARDDDAVLHTEQTLTDEQKAQARENIGAAPDFSTKPIAATSTDGVVYTATVEGISSLDIGVSFILIPHVASNTNDGAIITLNVNNLGAKEIRRHTSLSANYRVTDLYLAANRPVRVTYDGTYWILHNTKPLASDIQGVVPIEHGGTNANTASGALESLGAAAKDHKQSADTIMTGTFYGQVKANSSEQTHTISLLRNSQILFAEVNPTVNGEINWVCE